MIESIEKLRDELRICETTGSRPTIAFVAQCADEIEAEIESRYMLLPVDADGVPIRVGDEIEFRNGDTHERGNVQCLSDCWVNFGGHSYYGVMDCRHVKPRTIEDVLREFAEKCAEGSLVCAEADVRKYADELRELMEVDR